MREVRTLEFLLRKSAYRSIDGLAEIRRLLGGLIQGKIDGTNHLAEKADLPLCLGSFKERLIAHPI